MASNKSNGGRKAVGLAAAVVTMAPVVVPLVEKIVDELTVRRSPKSELIMIPPLYDKGFPIKLEEAVEFLNVAGLKPILSELTIKEANAKYKDCFAFQVVGSNPSHKQRVPAGTGVFVKYITQEVIDESQKIFDEAERQRFESKRVNTEKRTQQVEHAQKIVIDAALSAKDGLGKIISHRKSEDHHDTESDK